MMVFISKEDFDKKIERIKKVYPWKSSVYETYAMAKITPQLLEDFYDILDEFEYQQKRG